MITMVVLALGFTMTTQAQKKEKKELTVAERTEHKVAKMTEDLGLSADQVKQVTPLIEEQAKKRAAMKAKRKAAKAEGKEKPTEAEKEAMKSKKKASKAAYNAKMKTILNVFGKTKLRFFVYKKVRFLHLTHNQNPQSNYQA